jgi:hypothetical protein
MLFSILSYIVLSVFFLTLRHKMIGVELVVACQMVYFSYAFNTQPSFLMTSIEKLNLVTGYRAFFHQNAYNMLLDPFCLKFEINRQFLENNFAWVVIVAILIIIAVIMVVYDLKHPYQPPAKVVKTNSKPENKK